MTTARDICTDAIKESGALGVGQTALSEDINDAFTRLQRMVALWQQKRWLVPSLQSTSIQWNSARYNTVGIGGDINIVRPTDIKAAYTVQLNTGSTPVSLPLKKIFSYEDYSRIAVKDLNSVGDYFFYDGGYPLAKLFVWPIPNTQYDVHIIYPNGLNFGSAISEGAITEGGTLYTEGAYETIELTGGSGTGAIADITVGPGGTVTIVNLSGAGVDYAIGDVLSAAAADIGGTGSGFEWTVGNITSNLDSEIIMPPEYEEALMYNLAIRVCSMYQVQPMEQTQRLAKAALNTIKMANTQVPALSMPAAPGLRTGKAFNLYNADGY